MANTAAKDMLLPPYSQQAEEAVIGSVLIDPDAIYFLAGKLQPDHFFLGRLSMIYDAVLHVHQRRMAIDMLTVADELENRGQLDEVGGMAELSKLISHTPTSVHAQHYSQVIYDHWIRRRLINASGELAQLAYNPGEYEDVSELLTAAEEIVYTTAQGHAGDRTRRAAAVAAEFYDQLEANMKRGDEMMGLPTGYTDMDKLLQGLAKGEYHIVAARPSVGKTSLATSVALNAALRHRQRVLFFSAEMTATALMQRMVASEGEFDATNLRRGRIDDDDWGRFAEVVARISGTSLWIDDTSWIPVIDLVSKARRIHAEHGLDLVIVDYIQLLAPPEHIHNRVQQVGYISKALLALCKDLNIPVLAVSQLSRQTEHRVQHKPTMADLRESGDLEQDAHVVMLLWKEDMYNENSERKNIVDVIVAKNRNGLTGTLSLYWQGQYVRFRDAELRTLTGQAGLDMPADMW